MLRPLDFSIYLIFYEFLAASCSHCYHLLIQRYKYLHISNLKNTLAIYFTMQINIAYMSLQFQFHQSLLYILFVLLIDSYLNFKYLKTSGTITYWFWFEVVLDIKIQSSSVGIKCKCSSNSLISNIK